MQKRTLAVVFFTAALCSLVIVVLGQWASYRAAQRLGAELKAIATTTALALDGDLHESVAAQPSAEDSDYKVLRSRLKRIVEAVSDHEVKYIFTMARTGRPNFLRIILNTDETDQAAKPGDLYDITKLTHVEEAFNAPIADDRAYRDEWDEWLFSAYAPVKNSKGEAIAIVGVDADADALRQAQARIFNIMLVCLGLGLFMSFPLGFYCAKAWGRRSAAAESQSVSQTEIIFESYLTEQAQGKIGDSRQWLKRQGVLQPALERKLRVLTSIDETLAQIRRAESNGQAKSPPSPGPKRSWPKQLGDFMLLAPMAQGGMATVYLARQISLKRLVALKVMERVDFNNQRAHQRFKREAEAVAALSHPNIVTVYAFGSEVRYCYIAFELLRAVSLERIIFWRQGRLSAGSAPLGPKVPLPPAAASGAPGPAAGGHAVHAQVTAASGSGLAAQPEPQQVKDFIARELSERAGLDVSLRNWNNAGESVAWRFSSYIEFCRDVAADICRALEHAHARGVCHRDIKPSNILVDESGTARLIDFGLTRSHELSAITGTHDFVGTIHYAAPEQMEKAFGAVGPASDIYSLGVTLYEMLALRKPFTGESFYELALQIKQGAPEFLSKSNPLIPAKLEQAVLTALEKNPSQRFPSALAFRQELATSLMI